MGPYARRRSGRSAVSRRSGRSRRAGGGGGATLLPWVFTSGSPGGGAFWARLAGTRRSCAAARMDNPKDNETTTTTYTMIHACRDRNASNDAK